MHVVQQLARCEACSQMLALQYRWYKQELPSLTQDRIAFRRFGCPACGHPNPLVTVMYASSLEIKLVPGPAVARGFRPNTVRRLQLSFREDALDPLRPSLRTTVLAWQGQLQFQNYWPHAAWWLAECARLW